MVSFVDSQIRNVLDGVSLAGTEWGVHVAVDGSAVARVADKEILRTASVAKLFLLIETSCRIESGDLNPDRRLGRNLAAPVADSGLWQHLGVEELSVDDLAYLVGAASDNLATNVLLAVVGLDAVQARARQLALYGSMLHDRVRNRRGKHDPETLSTGCALDWVNLLAGLASGQVINPNVSSRVVRWISGSLDLSLVASGFGLDPLAHQPENAPLKVYNKTGTDVGVRCDVGFVVGPGALVTYAALCNWTGGERIQAAVLNALREIGALIKAEALGAGSRDADV